MFPIGVSRKERHQARTPVHTRSISDAPLFSRHFSQAISTNIWNSGLARRRYSLTLIIPCVKVNPFLLQSGHRMTSGARTLSNTPSSDGNWTIFFNSRRPSNDPGFRRVSWWWSFSIHVLHPSVVKRNSGTSDIDFDGCNLVLSQCQSQIHDRLKNGREFLFEILP
jgi:hypothetical protein